MFGAIGNGRREFEFYEELSDLLGWRPCVEPVEVAATWDTSQIEDVTDDMANENKEDDSQREPSTDYCKWSSAKKAKTSTDAMEKKRSKSSTKNKKKSEIVQMIEKIPEQRNKQENQYLEVMKKMHDDEMEVMKGLLCVLQTLAQDKSKDIIKSIYI